MTSCPVGDFEHLFAGTPPAPEFMGIAADRARALAAERGITMRVVTFDPDEPSTVALTLDHRPERLNVLIVDGVVVRAGYF